MSSEDDKPSNPYEKQSKWGSDITLEKNKGLFKLVLQKGEGPRRPLDGSKVTVHYVGRLLDGSVFDSSRERGEPFVFDLGKKSVIKGWEEGVKTMHSKEVALLTCKPEYAYGEKGSPPKIPANATLQFEVELLSWQGEDITTKKDGGVRRILLEKGSNTDYYRPKEGSTVKAHVMGRYQGRVFKDADVELVLGEGSESGVIEGVEVGLADMKKNEKVHLDILPGYAFGETGSEEFGVPPGAAVEYEVKLHEFDKMKETWDYANIKERVDDATSVKERGTKYFRENKFKLAQKVYTRALGIVNEEHMYKDEEKAESAAVRNTLRLNLAAVLLKLDEGQEAKEQCGKVLKNDEANVKAFFRRGQAYILMQEYEDAVADFHKCLELDPENKAAKTQLSLAQKKLKAFKAAEKRRYVKLFEKLSEELKNLPDEVVCKPTEMDKTTQTYFGDSAKDSPLAEPPPEVYEEEEKKEDAEMSNDEEMQGMEAASHEPQDGQETEPQDGQETEPQGGQETEPQDGQETEPQDGQETEPQDGQETEPPKDGELPQEDEDPEPMTV